MDIKYLLHKLMDIQDAQSQSRYAEARDITYRLICETRREIVNDQQTQETHP